MWTKPVQTDKSESDRENKDNNKLYSKKLLIAIPSFTGLIDCLAVEGFMRLMGSIYNLKEKYEVYTSILKRKPVAVARNEIVAGALKQDFDWILWIDDDMVINPDINIVEKLMAHNKDIIAPLFFTRDYPYIPLIFQRRFIGNTYCVYDNIIDYPKGLLKVDGIGFGCVLTKVELFKKLKQPYFFTNEVFSEDLYFCDRVTSAGIEIFCDSTIEVGHIGDSVVSCEAFHNGVKQANYDYIKDKNARDEKKAEEFYADLHKNIGKKIDIVIPCYHNVDITKNAIESIISLTEDVNYKIIAIIDGHDEDLIDYFKTKKDVLTLYHKESLGFIKSTNNGIKHVRGDSDFVLLLNNDVLIENPKWLINLINSFDDDIDDDIGAIAPISNFVMGIANIAYNNLPSIHYAKFLIGFCMLIKKDVLDKVGLLDERFGIGGNDDLDLSIRIREAGYKLKINRNVFVRHIGFCSLGLRFKDYKEVEDLTRPMLVEKWGKEKIDDLFTITNNFILNGV